MFFNIYEINKIKSEADINKFLIRLTVIFEIKNNLKIDNNFLGFLKKNLKIPKNTNSFKF